MPIVNHNHLSYDMKNENESFDDVKLVGFVRSDEDVKDRLGGNGCSSPKFWKRFATKENDSMEGENTPDTVKPSATNGHVNIAFLTSEPESCYCSNRVARKSKVYALELL